MCPRTTYDHTSNQPGQQCMSTARKKTTITTWYKLIISVGYCPFSFHYKIGSF